MSLLCRGQRRGWAVAVDGRGWLWGGVGGVVEEVPDASGDVSLQAAVGLGTAFPFGHFAVEVGAGVRAGPGAGERDAVKRAVELAVTAGVKRTRWVFPEEAGIGATPAWRAKCPSVGNRLAPAVRPIRVAAVIGPIPGSASRSGRSASISWMSSDSSWRSERVSSRIRL